MRPNRWLSAFFSVTALATSLLVACLLIAHASQAQSAQPAAPQRQPTAAEMSKKETVASAFLRGLEYQEYEVRSAAEAMPEEKYGYRPAEGKFKSEKLEFGPAEVRTFAQQVKHVACANLAFAAELDGQTPQPVATRKVPILRGPRKNCWSTCATPLPQYASPLEPLRRRTCSTPSKGPTPGRTRGWA